MVNLFKASPKWTKIQCETASNKWSRLGSQCTREPRNFRRKRYQDACRMVQCIAADCACLFRGIFNGKCFPVSRLHLTIAVSDHIFFAGWNSCTVPSSSSSLELVLMPWAANSSFIKPCCDVNIFCKLHTFCSAALNRIGSSRFRTEPISRNGCSSDTNQI